MRGWKDLELVETIYEEEDHDNDEDPDAEDDDDDQEYSSKSPSISPTLTPSPPTPLQSIAKTWSLATGIETDVLIHVQDRSFHLHKDPLISKSGYLKRVLADFDELTLSPPLKITAETFSSIVDYCYTYQISITPFNVAALRVAAELLEMSTDNGKSDWNLLKKTENYFCQAISVNREYACIVLRSCLDLLPAGDSALMATKCIEALTLSSGFEDANNWVDEIMSLSVDKFQLIADSIHVQFSHNHDLLYRIVDLYLEEHGKIKEEEKTRICGSVDCNKLSPHLILHAVQNPRLPLRFIVRAMLVEQLNTRRTVISSTTPSLSIHRHHRQRHDRDEVMTLGAILQRDTALRQVAQLKASMEATSSKIESLEKELSSMKKVLDSSKNIKRDSMESGRSASFRLERKIDREPRGTHSTSLRFSDKKDRNLVSSSSSSSSEISISMSVKTKSDKKFGWKLMNGLKNALRISSPSSKQTITESMVSSKVDESNNAIFSDLEEDEVIILDRGNGISHRRTHSLV
ncbi:hypothetical protein ACHQM5_015698 [Ranunculus cassubicifolius]